MPGKKKKDVGSQLKHMVKTDAIKHSVGKEMKDNPPRILAKTKAKYGPARAEAQRKAIFLNKSRKRGAKV